MPYPFTSVPTPVEWPDSNLREARQVFSAFDYTSFYSIWYWILTVAIWTQVCHRTLGVPYDMILRAERLPAVAEQVDALARISAARVAAIQAATGVWLAGLGGFGIAALGVLGLGNGMEPALAAFLLLLPLAVVGHKTARLAVQIDQGDLTGRDLRQRLSRRRAWNQAIAFAATVVAAFAALFFHPVTVLMRW